MQLGTVRTKEGTPNAVTEFPILEFSDLPDDRLRAKAPDGIGAIPTLPVDQADEEIARVKFPNELRVIVQQLFHPEYVVGLANDESDEVHFWDPTTATLAKTTIVSNGYGADSWSIEDFAINPVDGTMAVLNDDELWKLDEDGRRLWEHDTGQYQNNRGGEHYLTLGRDGSVYTGMINTDRNFVMRLSPTGNIIWQKFPQKPVNGIVLDRDGSLLTLSRDSYLSRVNPETGNSVWVNNSTDLSNAIGLTVTYKNGYTIWTGTEFENTIRQFNQDGSKKTEFAVNGVGEAYNIEAVGDGVVVIADGWPSETAVAYDDTGAKLWEHTPSGRQIQRVGSVPAHVMGTLEPQVILGHEDGIDQISARSGTVTTWTAASGTIYRAVASQWGEFSTWPERWSSS